jgi:hypothetical protein
MDLVGFEPTTSALFKGNFIFYLNWQQLWNERLICTIGRPFSFL